MLSVRGQIAALAGRREEADAVLQDLEARARGGYVSPYNRAAVYAALGDLDSAFVWLERAYEERSSSLVYLRVSPLLASIRSDARFDLLQARIDSGGTSTASGTR
jgi:predicted Zn-dependent protease